MEKFAVDLDKVLDEFEKHEEEEPTPPRQTTSQTSLTTFLHNLDPIAPPQDQQPPTSTHLSPSFESLFTPTQGTKTPSQALEDSSKDSKLPSAVPSEVSLHYHVPQIVQNHVTSDGKKLEWNLEGTVADAKNSANKEHSLASQSNTPKTNGGIPAACTAPIVNGFPPETKKIVLEEQNTELTNHHPEDHDTKSITSDDQLEDSEEDWTLAPHPAEDTSLKEEEINTQEESQTTILPREPTQETSSQIDIEEGSEPPPAENLAPPSPSEQPQLTSSQPSLSSQSTFLPPELSISQPIQEIGEGLTEETIQCEVAAAATPSKELPSDDEDIELTRAPESDIEFQESRQDSLSDSEFEVREHVLVFEKSKEKLDEGECKMANKPLEQEEEEEEFSKDRVEDEVKPLGFSEISVEENCTLDNIKELEDYLEVTQVASSSSSSDSLEPLVEPSPESDFLQEATVQQREAKTQLQEDEEEDEGLQSAESPSQEEGCSTDVEESTSMEEEGASSPRKQTTEVARCDQPSMGDCNCSEARAVRPTFLNLPESQSRLPPMEMPPPAEPQLGRVKPVWVPDSEARNCMLCNLKFTVIRRRHHCRTCGKVLCSQCCNQKTKLPYLQNKEGRVCQPCFLLLSQASSEPGGQGGVPPEAINSPGMTPFHGWSPSPNHPQEYCSTLPPHQQVSPRAPPTVMVPVGVLKNNSVRAAAGQSPQSGEPKQVMFFDGIRPGGDLQDCAVPMPIVPKGRHTSNVGPKSVGSQRRPQRAVVSDSEGSLPPLVLPPDASSNFKPDPQELFNMLQDTKTGPLCFALTKNLFVEVKLVTLSCCLGPRCWTMASQGLRAVGQDEVLLVLEREPEERAIPRCAFRLLRRLWDDASRGQPASSDLGHVLFPEGLFGSREQSGFLLVRPTFQCLDRLPQPAPPFLLAILIQRWEVPWAKVFPLRLALRLGAEFRRYPCPVVSCRSRKPVYGEVGHTIMSVLADLRNFQFTVPSVPGVVIHMQEGGSTVVRLPRNRWEAVRRLLAANEHVVALGGNFSPAADSHLVCFQREDGSYHTQAINIQNTTRKVIGCSFIVFSGALKSGRDGPMAKVGLVEDGMLVQLSAESLMALRTALGAMKDFSLTATADDTVTLTWVQDDRAVNIGVKSPIDGRPLDGVESVRIHTATDFASHHLLIRWTEVFFFREEGEEAARPDGPDPGRVAEAAAEAFCQAVAPHLGILGGGGTRVGLRLSLGTEKVEFDCGANGLPLPPTVLPALDTALIPLMSAPPGGATLLLELHFHILHK